MLKRYTFMREQRGKITKTVTEILCDLSFFFAVVQ